MDTYASLEARGWVALAAAREGSAEELSEAILPLPCDGALNECHDEYGRTAIHWAAARMPEMVAPLIGAGAAPGPADGDGETPLMIAAWNGADSAFFALLEAGADPKAVAPETGRGMIHYAAEGGSAAITAKCLSLGLSATEADADGTTPLHIAAERSGAAVAGLLLAAGAEPDARDCEGKSPLHAAVDGAWDGDRKVAAMAAIVAAGGDPDGKDGDGMTPLHMAASHGESAAVSFFIEAGANPAARNDKGEIPLHLAAKGGHGKTDSARMLIPSSDIEARDKNGRTPLHAAAANGADAGCMVLLAAGADPTAKDSGGRRPADLAVRGLAAVLSSAAEKAELAAEVKPAVQGRGRGRI